MINNNQRTFLLLVSSGLWSDRHHNAPAIGYINACNEDWNKIYELAEEQSVVGLVAAGLEYIENNVLQAIALTFASSTLQIEQRNKEMNFIVADLIDSLRRVGVYCILVKGQGIAQCYERPLWRSSGDVDLFLSDEN